MRKDFMNFYEVEVAAHNIKSIESALGHPIPGGMVDVSELGDHLMNPIEVAKVAYNIESVISSTSRRSSSSNEVTGLNPLGTLVLWLIYAALAYAGGSILLAFLSVLFN